MITASIPGFTGELIAPGSEGYDQARMVWNAAIGSPERRRAPASLGTHGGYCRYDPAPGGPDRWHV